MSILDSMRLDQQMIALISLGFRPPVVSILVNKKVRQVRAIWHEIHGCPPPRGRLPESTETCLRSVAHIMHANVFANIYVALLPDQCVREGKIIPLLREPLISAFKHYVHTNRTDDHTLSADQAYVIIRDLQCGLSTLRYCTTCRSYWIQYLSGSGTKMQSCSSCKYMAPYRTRPTPVE